jgi:hypothetical protein
MNNLASLFPWHQENWLTLMRCHQRQSLPHALLLHGAVGLGKLRFAFDLAQFLLCSRDLGRNGDGDSVSANADASVSGVTLGNIEKLNLDMMSRRACSRCKSCAMFQSNNHPDFFLIQPLQQSEGSSSTSKSGAIKIEQIRELIDDIGNTAHQGGRQIVVINPAEKMNIAAANALLKTLEEPVNAATIIILVSAQPALLPPTILSRCQKVEFKTPEKNIGLAWLKQQVNSVGGVATVAVTVNAAVEALSSTGGARVENGIATNDNLLSALQLAHGAPLAALDLLASEKLSLRRKILSELFTYLKHSVGNSGGVSAAVRAVTVTSPTPPISTISMDVSSRVEEFVNVDPAFLLNVFISVVDDFVKCKLQAANSYVVNQDFLPVLHELSQYCVMERLLNYQQELLGLKKTVAANIALNKQLLLENLWLSAKACL